MTQDRYYENSRPEMVKFVPPEAKTVLEIGCGSGQFGREVKSVKGCEYHGVEIHEPAARRAREVLDLVWTGDAMQTLDEVPDRYYDCVVLNDVLEHLTDPEGLLGVIDRKLKQDGVITASIPNVRFWSNFKSYVFDGDWEYQDTGILDRTHVRFYTKKSIRRLFEGAGYEIEQLCGINPTQSRSLRVWSLLSLGRLRDTWFRQFACVARRKRQGERTR